MGGVVVGVDRSAHAMDALRFAIEEATVRSRKCDRNATKPVASIGWAIMTSGGRPSAVGRGPWMS